MNHTDKQVFVMRKIISVISILFITLTYSMIASGQTISGSIHAGEGQPLPGGYVRIFNSSGEDLGEAHLDEIGDFEFGPLVDDNYFAITIHTLNTIDEIWDGVDGSPCLNMLCDVLTDGTAINITGGASVTGIDFVLDPITSGGTISGHVEDFTGAPLGAVNIPVSNRNGFTIWDLKTDEDGNYVSPLLADETYYVHTQYVPWGLVGELYNDHLCLPAYDCLDPAYIVANGTPVVIDGSDPEPANFVLALSPTGHMLSGRIRNDDPVHDFPMPDIQVHLLDPVGNDLAHTRTDLNGNYYFPGLEEGFYKVYTSGVPEGYAAEVYPNSPCENWDCQWAATGSVIQIAGAHSQGNNIDLNYTGTRIFGTVTRSDNGDPVSAEFGWFSLELYDDNGDHAHRVHTNSAGQYQFDFDSPGDYYLVTNHDESYHSLFNEGWDDVKCSDCNPLNFAATLTSVVVDGTVIRDFVLDPAPTISGTVTAEEGGALLADIEVCVDRRDETRLSCAWTDSGGVYTIAGLYLEDDLIVYVTNTNGQPFVMEAWNNTPIYLRYTDGEGVNISVSNAIGIDFALADGTIVSGTMLSSHDGPINEGAVSVRIPSGDWIAAGHAEPNGAWSVALAPGDYYFYFEAWGTFNGYIDEYSDGATDLPCWEQSCEWPGNAPLVTVGETPLVLDNTLQRGFQISGIIRDQDSFPTGEGYVNIWDASGNQVFTAHNDGGGNYQALVAEGTYFATARGEDWGRVSQLWQNKSCPQEYCDITGTGTAIVLSGADITGIDFVLVPQVLSWTISGSILNEAEQSVGGGIRLFDPHGNGINQYWADGEGNFQTEPLADGTYFATTLNTDGVLDEAWQDVPCINQVCDATSGTPIVINGGDEIGIDFVLAALSGGGHISGNLSGPGGPLANTGVSILNRNAEHLLDLTSGPDGNYQTPLLANDDYYVHTIWEPLGLGSELYDNQPCVPNHVCRDPAFVLANGTVITVNNADEIDKDFFLEVPPGGKISGQVTDAALGVPLPDMELTLLDGFGNPMSGTNVDQYGNYYFSGLNDGDYKVAAVYVPEGYNGELFDNVPCNDWGCNTAIEGTTITITDANTMDGKDFALDFVGTRIFGTITRSDSGDPVSNHYGQMMVSVFDADNNHFDNIHANSAGQYWLFLDGPGDYYLTTDNDFQYHGLINESWDNVQCFDSCGPEFPGATLIPVANGTTVIADFELDPGYVLSGVIKDEADSPTGEGNVHIWDAGGNQVTTAFNDGGGNYQVLLPAGTYFATAKGENWGRVSQLWQDYPCPQEYCDITVNGTPIVIPGGEGQSIDFNLVPREWDWTISGTILDAEGQPTPRGAVQIFSPGGRHYGDFWADENGVFQSDLLADGNYFAVTYRTWDSIDDVWDGVDGSPCVNRMCDVFASTPILVSGGDRDDIHFVLDPILSGGNISGNVTGPGGPLGDTDIIILNSNGEGIQHLGTDQNGSYESKLLADDTYYVRTDKEPLGYGRELWDDFPCLPAYDCFDPAYITGNGDPVHITGADPDPVNFDLDLPGTGYVLSGKITDDGPGASIGMPLADIQVHLLGDDGSDYAYTQTDGEGDYYFSGLADGLYKVYTSGVPEGYVGEVYPNAACPDWSCDISITGTAIEVSGADSPGNDIALAFTGTRIIGTVTRSDGGAPVSEHWGQMYVGLFDADGNHLYNSHTNHAGQYQFNQHEHVLSPGDYYLLTQNDSQSHGLINEGWDNHQYYADYDPFVVGADVISILDGETVVADFVLDPGRNISGTVTAEDGGALLADIEVCVQVRHGPHMGCAQTDSIGEYTVKGLFPETDLVVYVESTNGQPYLLETWDNKPYGDWSLGDGVDVSTSDATGVNFTLESGFFIAGTVLDPDTAPVVDVDICIHRTDGSFTDVCGNTDSEGVYQAGFLPAGTDYTAYVLPEHLGYKLQMWENLDCLPDSCDFSTATPIILGPGDATGIDFNLTSDTGITGVIRSSVTGDVVPHDGRARLYSSDRNFVAQVGTDDAGSYRLSGLEAGDYFILARPSDDNLIDELWNGPGDPGVHCPRLSCNTSELPAALITLSEGEVADGIDVELDPGSQITGNLTIDDNTAEWTPIFFYTPNGDYAGIGRSDETGSFHSRSGFPSGFYYASNRYVFNGNESELHAEFWPTTYLESNPDGVDCGSPCAIETSGGTLIGVDGSTVTDLNSYNYVSQPPATISGSILDNNYRPTSGGAVQLLKTSGDWSQDFWVDGNGHFETHPLSPGTYVMLTSYTWGFIDERWDGIDGEQCLNHLCDIYGGTQITIYGGNSVTGINFVLNPVLSGGRISGNVSGPGGPLSNMSVVILNRDGEYVDERHTDPNGDYEGNFLPDETYYARTNNEPLGLVRELHNGVDCLPANNCGDPAFVTSNGLEIVISGSDHAPVNFVLALPLTGHMISGKITDDGPGESLDIPLVRVGVHLLDASGNWVADTHTDQYGDYYFSGLADGSYRVYTSQVPEGYIGEFFPDAACPDWNCDTGATGGLIVLSGADSLVNNIALAFTGTRLFGTVTRSDGGDPVNSLLADMHVGLFDAGGTHLGDSYTNTAGQYEFLHLGTGRYFLVTNSDHQYHGLIDEGWDDSQCFGAFDPFDCGADFIDITDGETLVRDFALETAPNINGIVTADDGGAPIEGVEVCTARQSDEQWLGCGETDAVGYYELKGLLPTADMVVWINALNGQPFFQEMHDNQPCCDISQGTPVDIRFTDGVVDFQLLASASVSGKVRDSSTGFAIKDVSVQLLTAQCDEVQSAVSDSDGNYTISGFNEGVYYLYAQDYMQNYISTLYPHLNRYSPCDPDVQDGWPIAIGDFEHQSGYFLDLDPGASINGSIFDTEGGPLGGAGRARLYDTTGNQITVVGQSDWSNSYRIGALMPGSYHLVFSSYYLGLIDERYNDVECPRNSCPSHLGTAVVVGGAEHVLDHNADLGPGAVIRGRITDFATGSGVPDFGVAILTAGGDYAGYSYTDAEGNYESVTAFPDGEYLLSNYFPARYSNNDHGYLPQVWTNDEAFGDCGAPCEYMVGDTFTVSGLSPVEGINLVMEHGSTISGSVEDTGAGPLANIEIRLLSSIDGSVLRSVITDETGAYSLEGVRAGIYYLRTFNTSGFEDLLWGDTSGDVSCNPSCNPFSGADVVTNGSNSLVIDFVLQNAPEIQGKVTDNLGADMVGVRVEAYNTLGTFVRSANTDATGNYAITNLWAGSFFVRTANNEDFVDAVYDGQFCESPCDPTSGTSIPLVAGPPQTGIDLQLGLAASITGTVDEGIYPIPGVKIELYRNDGDFVTSTTTDGAGGYSLIGLAAGDYHLVTRNEFGYIDESASGEVCQSNCAPTSTTAFSLAVAGPPEVKDFTLELGGYITGTVSGDGALPDVTITAFNSDRAPVASTVTAPDGTYVISGLADGHVYLRTFNAAPYRNQRYDGLPCDATCNVLEGTAIAVGPGIGVAGKDFVLESGFSISGVITDTSTDGIGGVLVEAFDMENLQVAYGVSVAGGAFEIDGLPAGDYRLRTTNDVGLIDEVVGGDSCSPEPCTLLNGDVTSIDNADVNNIFVELATGTRITGVVTDIAGNELPTGIAWLYSSTGQLLKSTAVNNGLFNFSGNAPGTYHMLISNNLGLIDQLYSGIPCPSGSCDVTSGTEIIIAAPAAEVIESLDRMSAKAVDPPRVLRLSVVLDPGYHISGSVFADGQPVTFTKVYIFDESGNVAGEGTTDGLGNFESDAGFPTGVYYAATSRAARDEDSAEEAADAENGVGRGLVDQIWAGVPCVDICAPAFGNGTPIEISGDDVTGIDFVLVPAPGVAIEKLTNGIDADTPNGGDAPEISAGETVNWTYEVTNTGGGDLVLLSVTDDKGVVVTCPEGNLVPDETVECTGSAPAVDLREVPGVVGNCAGRPGSTLYQNIATVHAETTDDTPIPVEDQDTSHYCNPLSADLAVSKTDGQTTVTPGESTTYTIVVSNNGPDPVSDANVTDSFTTGLSCSYTSLAAGGATGNTPDSSGDISDILDLPVGASVTYTVPCDIAAGATGTLSNTASVSSAVPDPVPGNDSATDDSALVPSADLTITKTDNLESVVSGSTTSYTIVVNNNGPSDVTEATVADTFPVSLVCTYTSSNAAGVLGNTKSGDGDIDDTLVLPVGSWVSYTADCDIDVGATGTLSNTATVSSAVSDPVSGNESAMDMTTLYYCSYAVSKPVGGETWRQGDTYSVNWNSSGNNCATTVDLELFKGGIFDRTIATATGDMTFEWSIPMEQVTGDDFKVRVTDSDNPDFYGDSASEFIIAVPSCNVNMVSGVTADAEKSYEACEILVLGPDFTTASGADVTLSSGWEIDFMPGFMVEQGATLKANVCGQSLCLISLNPMPRGCHSCVDLICAADANCCDVGFNEDCLDMVDTVCHLVCE